MVDTPVDTDNFLQVPEGVEIQLNPLLLEQQLGLDDFVVQEAPKPVVLTPQSASTQRILQRTRDRNYLQTDGERPLQNLLEEELKE